MQRPRAESLVSSGSSQLQYAGMEVGVCEGKGKDRGRMKRHQTGEAEGNRVKLVRKIETRSIKCLLNWHLYFFLGATGNKLKHFI